MNKPYIKEKENNQNYPEKCIMSNINRSIKMKEKNKGLIITIIILAIFLFATTGYIIYDKVITKEEVEEKENNEQEEVVEEDHPARELTEEEQSILTEQIKEYSTYLAMDYPVADIRAISNQSALQFALYELNVSGNDFMESDLEKQLKKYFGNNHPFIHEDIECYLDHEPLYTYDSATREYTFQDIHGHGGSGYYRPTVFFVDGTAKDNTYTVEVNIIYADYCSGLCGPMMTYYKTSGDSINSTNEILSFDEEHQVTEEEYQMVKDTLDITTFTFEKDKENNYGLKTVDID